MVRALSCSGRAKVVLGNLVLLIAGVQSSVYLVTEAADVVEEAIAEFAGSHFRFVACRLLTADRRRKWVGAGSRYHVVLVFERRSFALYGICGLEGEC